jgi:hypothetical protein
MLISRTHSECHVVEKITEISINGLLTFVDSVTTRLLNLQRIMHTALMKGGDNVGLFF